MASAGDVGAPCGRCGVARRRASRPDDRLVDRARRSCTARSGRARRTPDSPPPGRSRTPAPADTDGEEVLEIEAHHHAPPEVRAPRACAPSARGRTRAPRHGPGSTPAPRAGSSAGSPSAAPSGARSRAAGRSPAARARTCSCAASSSPAAPARARRPATRAGPGRAPGAPPARRPCRSAAPATAPGTTAGWKIELVQHTSARAAGAAAPRARSRCRRRARAGGPAAAARRPRGPPPRRARSHARRPIARRPRAAIASGSHSPARNARGEDPPEFTQRDQGVRRRCPTSLVVRAQHCAEQQPGARDALPRYTASSPGNPRRRTFIGADSGTHRRAATILGGLPEGDTIHYAANKIRPVLAGHVPDSIETPHPRFGRDRWPEKLAGQAVTGVDAHGKHLFLRFEGGFVIHSHLRMTGKWRVRDADYRIPRNAWLVIRREDKVVAQINGPRARADDRLAAPASIGAWRSSARTSSPPSSTKRRSSGACARTTPRAPIGDALLDQRVIAGIGNLWKAEGCFAAGDRSVAAHRRRLRRGGAGDRPRDPAADAGVRARRHAGALQGRLRHRRRAVPALRRGVAHQGARPGRRQPDDILVSTMPALRRIGHKGADLIVPGNTPASFDAALEHGVDMIEFDVLEHEGRLLLAHDYEHVDGAPTLEEGLAHLASSAVRRHRARRRPQAARLRGARRRGAARATG